MCGVVARQAATRVKTISDTTPLHEVHTNVQRDINREAPPRVVFSKLRCCNLVTTSASGAGGNSVRIIFNRYSRKSEYKLFYKHSFY
jgi:hypothetical protein